MRGTSIVHLHDSEDYFRGGIERRNLCGYRCPRNAEEGGFFPRYKDGMAFFPSEISRAENIQGC